MATEEPAAPAAAPVAPPTEHHDPMLFSGGGGPAPAAGPGGAPGAGAPVASADITTLSRIALNEALSEISASARKTRTVSSTAWRQLWVGAERRLGIEVSIDDPALRDLFGHVLQVECLLQQARSHGHALIEGAELLMDGPATAEGAGGLASGSQDGPRCLADSLGALAKAGDSEELRLCPPPEREARVAPEPLPEGLKGLIADATWQTLSRSPNATGAVGEEVAGSARYRMERRLAEEVFDLIDEQIQVHDQLREQLRKRQNLREVLASSREEVMAMRSWGAGSSIMEAVSAGLRPLSNSGSTKIEMAQERVQEAQREVATLDEAILEQLLKIQRDSRQIVTQPWAALMKIRKEFFASLAGHWAPVATELAPTRPPRPRPEQPKVSPQASPKGSPSASPRALFETMREGVRGLVSPSPPPPPPSGPEAPPSPGAPASQEDSFRFQPAEREASFEQFATQEAKEDDSAAEAAQRVEEEERLARQQEAQEAARNAEARRADEERIERRAEVERLAQEHEAAEAAAQRAEEELLQREAAEAARRAEEESLKRDAAEAAQRVAEAAGRAEEERLQQEAAEAARRAEEDRLKREATEAGQRAEEECLQQAAAEAARRAEEERLQREAAEAAQRAEEERLQQAAAEATRRAEEERLQREAAKEGQRAEEERLQQAAAEAARRAEEERLQQAAAEAARRAEEERLLREAGEAAQRAEEERLHGEAVNGSSGTDLLDMGALTEAPAAAQGPAQPEVARNSSFASAEEEAPEDLD